SRAYPKRISGKLLNYKTDVEKGKANFEWKENTKDNSLIYIPEFYKLDNSKIQLTPEGKGFELNKVEGGWEIDIPSIKKQRKLLIEQTISMD
ncbi:MAG: hypothetical protein ABFR05_06655, partial [Bacteroidota bacterium]